MESMHIIDPSDLNIERENIVHLAKLIVKDILRVAVRCNRQLSEDNPLIIQLLRVLERVVVNGLRPKKLLNSVSISAFSQIDPWPMICDLLKSSSSDIILTVQQMSIKSGIGRFRAWAKLALMQKQLGDYFRILTENGKKLETYYYPTALLLQESGTEVSGLLLGLCVVECNFIKFKENIQDVDSFTGPLNYSNYLTIDFDIGNNNVEQDSPETLKSLLDQKNYTEELNSILQAKVLRLQEIISSLENDSSNMKFKVAELTNQNLYLSEQVNSVKAENDLNQNKFDHKSKLMQEDLDIERSTYQVSRQELHQLNLKLERKLKEETQMRLDSDKALQLEVQKKSDFELAMNNLERQVQEKQETILNLRKQLEKIKDINIELNNDMKNKQSILDHKLMMVEKLEEKTLGMASIMDQMDQRIKKMSSEKTLAEKMILDMKQQLDLTDNNCLEKDEVIARLSREIEKNDATVVELKDEIRRLQDKEEKYITQNEYLEREMLTSKKRCQEQAEALEEMAGLVEVSKLQTDDLREMQASLHEAKWTDDKEIVDCNQCGRPFSVSRRKHHCRRCGGVFCHDCSSSRMKLASSSKPMRVCDTCHNVLLKNYTSMTSNCDSTD